MAVTRGTGNVFLDIGFEAFEAQELAVKSDLIAMIATMIAARGLTQTAAAKLCGTHQTSLSKILSGRLDSVTIDQLTKWIVALGGDVSISVSRPAKAKPRKRGSLTLQAH